MECTMNNMLAIARRMEASDLHISVGTRPKVRLLGELEELQEFERIDPALAEELVKSMMKPDQIKIYDETGEMDFSYSVINTGRFRVNAFKQRGTCGAVLRLINTEIPSPEKLGIPPSVMDICNRKRGMVLVTGPTGSGKSTTLAAMINAINSKRKAHIITLEDPIEYLHYHKLCNVNQREIGIDTLSFANALRASLREDPDIILVGEMRDPETIQTAITAAETGHLVFSTLHTIGAAPTIDRIIDSFPPHQQTQIKVQLSMVLECVVSQQLLPTMDGKKRVAAFEVMLSTSAISNLIREGKTHQIPSHIQTSKKMGMVMMDDFLFDLYVQRKIDASKAVEFAQDPDSMRAKVL